MPDADALPTVVYVGGMGRSGSTLTSRLLGKFSGVCTAGEIVPIWRRGIVKNDRCGCGEPFLQCPFWKQVGTAAFGGWDKVDVIRIAELQHAIIRARFVPLLAAPALRPGSRPMLDEYVSYFLRVYRAIGQVSGCQVIVDTSKYASLALCLRRVVGLDLKVIHLVRDSRAVAYSWARKVSRPETAAASNLPIYGPAKAAWLWNVENGGMEVLVRTRTPTLRVRYEDLVMAPHETLARIAAFGGLPGDHGERRFVGGDKAGHWADLGVAHTISGNPMRFGTGRIAIRLDDEWRTVMTAAQRQIVTTSTLPLLARYGYLRRTQVA
jgi:hypothetical protein